MTALKLSLFGVPRLEASGSEIRFSRRKAMALLTFLAVTGDAHYRDRLSFLFWPESSGLRARAALRRELHEIRKPLPNDILTTTADTIELNKDVDLWLDVNEFRNLIRRHTAGHAAEKENLERAIDLYRSAFLEGFTVKGAPEFEDWQRFEANEYQQELLTGLDRIIEIYRSDGDFAAALPFARHRVQLDNYHEPAHRTLMELYAQCGQHALALRHYEDCRRLFEEDLGLPLESATDNTFEAIRTRSYPDEPVLSPVGILASLSASDNTNVPPPPQSFVGREVELAELTSILSRPSASLVTIFAPGGTGKTSLALAVAAELAGQFADGTYFVDLTPLQHETDIISALADALDLVPGPDRRSLKRQLVDYLRSKDLLLILDNFEHLLDHALLVDAIIQAAPRVRILVTSRERLRISSEHLFTLDGLAFPEKEEEFGRSFAAREMFLQSYQRIRPKFRPTEEDEEAILQISRHLQGMPLAILLASSWAELLSPPEIAEQMQQSLDFLQSDLRDLPIRQRSMRNVLSQSWARLNAGEQEIFLQLSSFHGGFSRQAAEAVAGASLHDCLKLTRTSLLSRDASGRFRVHQLLRQMALEHLENRPELAESTRRRHARFYLKLVSHLESGLKGANQHAVLDELDIEFSNIRSAWHHAHKEGRQNPMLAACDCMNWFFEWAGRFEEGERFYSRVPIESAAPHMLTVKCLTWSANLAWIGGRLDEAAALLERARRALPLARIAGEESLEVEADLDFVEGRILQSWSPDIALESLQRSLSICKKLRDPWRQAKVSMQLVALHHQLGSHEEIEALLQQSLKLSRALSDWRGMADALTWLSWRRTATGAFYESEELLMEGLHLREQVGDRAGLARNIRDLAGLHMYSGKFDEALRLNLQSIDIYRRMGDINNLSEVTILAGMAEIMLGRNREAEQHLVEAGHLLRGEFDSAKRLLAFIRGLLALAERKLEKARSHLSALTEGAQSAYQNGAAAALMAYIERANGNPEVAHAFLDSAISRALDADAYFPSLICICVAAILKHDQGNVAQTRELYTLAMQHEMVARSRWFQDVFGRILEPIGQESLKKEVDSSTLQTRQTTLRQALQTLSDAEADSCG